VTPRLARATLLVAAASWGLTFVANHELLEVLAPVEITVLRFAMVSVALGLLITSVPALRPRFTRVEWLLLLGGGVLAVPGAQLALTTGQRFLSPAMSGLVVAMGPAFAAVLAVTVLRERLLPRAWVGIALAFTGAAVVIVFTSGTGTELTVRNPWGAALVALAQLCWASFTVFSKTAVGRHPPITVVSVAVIMGTVLLLPAAPGAVRAAVDLDPARWGWLLHLALLGTVVPYLIWFTALRQLPANETAAFMFLIPLFAMTWSAVVLGERPAWLGLVGGAAIVAGVALTQRLGRARADARPPDRPPEPVPEVHTP
jgi:drug/metabolite transporter (DMT)-like permease